MSDTQVGEVGRELLERSQLKLREELLLREAESVRRRRLQSEKATRQRKHAPTPLSSFLQKSEPHVRSHVHPIPPLDKSLRESQQSSQPRSELTVSRETHLVSPRPLIAALNSSPTAPPLPGGNEEAPTPSETAASVWAIVHDTVLQSLHERIVEALSKVNGGELYKAVHVDGVLGQTFEQVFLNRLRSSERQKGCRANTAAFAAGSRIEIVSRQRAVDLLREATADIKGYKRTFDVPAKFENRDVYIHSQVGASSIVMFKADGALTTVPTSALTDIIPIVVSYSRVSSSRRRARRLTVKFYCRSEYMY